MSLSFRIGHRPTLSPQELHITVTTHNCSISSKSGVHFPGIPPHKPRHSFLSFTILLACPTFKLPFLFQTVHLFSGRSTKLLPIHSPSYTFLAVLPSPILSIWLFIHPLSPSEDLSNLCIRYSIHSTNTQQTSEVVHLQSSNPRTFFFLSASLSHCHTTEQHVQCIMQHFRIFKVQTPSVNQRPDSHFPTTLGDTST